jgi:hypothetical protein
MYFFPIYKEKMGDLFGEIKKWERRSELLRLTQNRPFGRLTVGPSMIKRVVLQTAKDKPFDMLRTSSPTLG